MEVLTEDATVALTATVPDEVPTRLVTFAAQPFADSAERLVMRLTRSSGLEETPTLVELDLVAHARWSDAETEPEKQGRFVHMCRSTLIDGRPLIPDEGVSKLCAFNALTALDDPDIDFPEVARRVSVWRGVARELGLSEVQHEIGKVLRLRAQHEAGEVIDPTEWDGLAKLSQVAIDEFATSLV